MLADEDLMTRLQRFADADSHVQPHARSTEVRNESIEARQGFFETIEALLPEGAQAKMKKTREQLTSHKSTAVPLTTFVEAGRTYDEFGISFSKVFTNFFQATTLDKVTIRSRIENLVNNGLNPAKVVNAQPSAMGIKETAVVRRLSYLGKLVKTLGWDGSAVQMVNNAPVLLSRDRRAIGVIARIMAERGDASLCRLSLKDVRTVAIRPIESALLTAPNTGINFNVPDLIRVSDRQRGKGKQAERVRSVEEAIGDEDTVKIIGKKTVLAYKKYRNYKEKPRIAK